MKNFFMLAMFLRVVLYSVNDYSLLQTAQAKLQDVTQNEITITRSNENLVEMQGAWNGDTTVVEAAQKALNDTFRLDASYQADDAMTLLFRKREDS